MKKNIFYFKGQIQHAGTHSYFQSVLMMVILLSICPAITYGQGADPVIRTAVRGEQVYVYHTLKISLGEGFNIYRSDEGGGFQKLNDQPVRGARDVSQFMGEVDEYMDLLMEAVKEDQPHMVYFKMQANRMAANLSSFYFPDVAQALGRLYIDTTATMSSTVKYKIEVVNDQGVSTGETISREVSLVPTEAPKPFELQAEHRRREVTLTWQYPTSSLENDDKVVRFNIYNRQNGKLKQINEKPIVRINNFEEFQYIFNVPKVGEVLNLIVVPVDLTMLEGPASAVLQYVVKDKVPPQVVNGLEARARRDGIVEITWPVSPEADAAGYNLYRANRIKGNYAKLNDEPIHLLETFYSDRPSRQRTSYFYRVTAVDSSGNESERSNAAKADVMDLTPPSAPQSLIATAREDGTIELQWKASAPEPDFKSFVITRRQLGRFAGSAEAQLNQKDISGTSFVDRGEAGLSLAEGARYQYTIFAADSARNFSDSASVVLKVPDLTPPEAPTHLTVENDRGIRAVLRWNASRSNDVVQYQVYRREENSELSVFRELTVNDRFVRDDSVKVGQTYQYAVSAVDSLGNEGQLTKIKEFQMKDFTPPRSVRNIRASVSSDTVTVTWEPVPTPDVTGYRIYIAPIPTGQFKLLTDETIKGTSFVAESLDPTSWVRVRAVDSSGNKSKPGEAAPIQSK